MGLIKELASLPTVTLSDGQDYVQIYDVLETVKRWKLSQPERKKGKWIERWHENKHVIGDMACSACGAQMLLTFPRFCPSCGADMRGEDYENDNTDECI